jgi:hypothetical protein
MAACAAIARIQHPTIEHAPGDRLLFEAAIRIVEHMVACGVADPDGLPGSVVTDSDYLSFVTF